MRMSKKWVPEWFWININAPIWLLKDRLPILAIPITLPTVWVIVPIRVYIIYARKINVYKPIQTRLFVWQGYCTRYSASKLHFSLIRRRKRISHDACASSMLFPLEFSSPARVICVHHHHHDTRTLVIDNDNSILNNNNNNKNTKNHNNIIKINNNKQTVGFNDQSSTG